MIQITIKRPRSPPVRRKPGERAKLTRGKILEAALFMADSGIVAPSILGIAKKLGVFPTAIYSHFPKGLDEINRQLARHILADSARPFQPNDHWQGYLHEFFWKTWLAVSQHRYMARIIASELTADYLLVPTLSERLLVTLETAGFSGDDLVHALEFVMASLIGSIAMEFPAGGYTPENAKATFLSNLKKLPKGEFEFLMKNQSSILASLDHRYSLITDQVAAQARCDRYTKAVIGGLVALSSTPLYQVVA